MKPPLRNALILHCHLPWLRHAESLHSDAEDWWLDVLTESLIPLLEMLHRLRDENLPFQITLAISPTVLAMMRDPLLQQRTVTHLDHSLHQALTEIERGTDPKKRQLAQWYADHYHRLHSYFCDRWDHDLVTALCDLRNTGHVEIPASAATHAILPLFLKSPDVLRTQIEVGCDFYKECFGDSPKLFWLPDCAYSPALNPFLKAAGIQHIILDEHALTYSKNAPKEGIYHPAQTSEQTQLSCRDIESSQQILKLGAGLLHDTRYRQAYKMSNEGTPVNALDLHLKARKHKPVATLKIRRMDSDDLYDPREGKKAVQEHAKHLIDSRLAQFAQLNATGIITPSIITVYEAELFGHWRFEGIPFLEEVLRQFNNRSGISLSSLHETSLTLPPNLVNPIPSSWGEGDYFENWLSPENAWIYPHLQRRATQLQRIVAALDQNIDGLSDELAEHRSRCVSQMTRELLLAQSSDWAALMRSPATQPYASKRFEDHLENFDRLATLYASNLGVNATELQSIERQTPLFPNLTWRSFSPAPTPSD